MVIPVDEESFNLITKSSKKIVEFVNGLKEDDKLISAVKSIPNMDSYLDGGEVAPILIAMSAQDIVSCLDALFGDVKLTTTGGIGLYTFFSQLNNNESSYLSYIHLALGGVEDEISDKISLFRHWGLNATTDEFVNVPYGDLTFTSNAIGTAKVDEKGIVTGVAQGETTITVEYKVGEEVKLTKTANVEVTTKA